MPAETTAAAPRCPCVGTAVKEPANPCHRCFREGYHSPNCERCQPPAPRMLSRREPDQRYWNTYIRLASRAYGG